MNYSDIPWLGLAAGLTALGLVLSYLIYQRRGLRPALLGTAVSLLPIAAYLTGSIQMIWKIGVAIGQFGSGFVFSPEKWAGIGVTGLAVALFLAAGGRERRKAAREARRAARADRARQQAAAERQPASSDLTAADRTKALATTRDADRAAVPAERAGSQPSGRSARRKPSADDDMKDIEDILRKRGI